jgi:NAD(P)-dependent dehydrogenase (short-subunit alcohol dehydrogenase family)
VPTERVARQFATNFYGTLAMAVSFAPVIEANGGGAIVNILTLVALASMPGLSTYNASKALAWSMTQSLRATLASRKIAAFGAFPGAVDTDMLSGVEMPKTAPADVARAVVQGIQAGAEDIVPDPGPGSWPTDRRKGGREERATCSLRRRPRRKIASWSSAAFRRR